MSMAAFKARRERLVQAMSEGIAIVPTAPERPRHRDAGHPYRSDSYFYYLTGFTEPDAVLAVIGRAEARSILFCRLKDEEREIGDGFRYGPEAAREAFGMDEAFPIEGLDEQMPALLGDRERLYLGLG